jgi:hypothetical protein
MNPNYNMAEMFGPRVRVLVNSKTELANLVHFARLFQSQLIAVSNTNYVPTSELKLPADRQA